MNQLHDKAFGTITFLEPGFVYPSECRCFSVSKCKGCAFRFIDTKPHILTLFNCYGGQMCTFFLLLGTVSLRCVVFQTLEAFLCRMVSPSSPSWALVPVLGVNRLGQWPPGHERVLAGTFQPLGLTRLLRVFSGLSSLLWLFCPLPAAIGTFFPCPSPTNPLLNLCPAEFPNSLMYRQTERTVQGY